MEWLRWLCWCVQIGCCIWCVVCGLRIRRLYKEADIYAKYLCLRVKRMTDGCTYCNGSGGFDGFVTNAVRHDKDDVPHWSNIETKFCPNCGRCLFVEIEEEEDG